MSPPLDPQGWQDSCQDAVYSLLGRRPLPLRRESLLTMAEWLLFLCPPPHPPDNVKERSKACNCGLCPQGMPGKEVCQDKRAPDSVS